MVKQEFVEMFKSGSVPELLKKSKDELSEMFGAEFAEMKDYEQNNPHHCYDLLEHTLRTVDGLDCRNLSDDEQLLLKTAALFHDIGKPRVAFVKKGKTVFYNHANVSEEIAAQLLEKSGFSKTEQEKICFYIKQHDMFISFQTAEEIGNGTNPYIIPITEETVLSHITKATENYAEQNGFVPSIYDFSILMQLCLADARAQSPVAIQDGKIISTVEAKVNRMNAILEIIKNIDNI